MKFFKKVKQSSELSHFTKDHFTSPFIHIGAYTYGLPVVHEWGEKQHLYIGKFCSIAEHVRLMLGGNHRVDWVSTYPFSAFSKEFPGFKNTTGHPASKGDIVIGNDVWLGMGCTILSGVTVGDGAVIGANSVVSKDIPPYAIAAGNPAKVVKFRFSPEEIGELLTIRWWHWDVAKINAHAQLICQPDITQFIKAVRNTEQ